MEDLIINVAKEFALVSVAIWILVFALYKLPISESKFPKELMAITVGIIVAIVGLLTGLYTGHPITIIATAIVSIFVSQTAYDKVKLLINNIKNG
ncbi:hypothetical protein ES707_14564 [subsurface metagenome]